jgi:tetratricopeptide (TPR) repeat protein
MKRVAALCVAIFICMCTGPAQEPPSSNDFMNRGVQAYKHNKYGDAQAAFEKAIELDPQNLAARLYLATTYMIQWVPGGASQQNVDFFQKAKAEFLHALDEDPNNKLALACLASMAYNGSSTGTTEEKEAALEEARKWNVRRTEVEPNDAEAFYYLGVIDWAECFPKTQAQRIEAHMSPDQPGPLPDGPKKQQIQETCAEKTEDGITNLRRVLELDPDNEDAMSYLNLTYRLKANLASSVNEARSFIEEAEQWANRSLETKRKKASNPR